MPCSAPVGFDRETGEFLELEENPYKKKAEPVYAVAALLPQGFTRLLCPAAVVEGDPLPILGYTAVGLEKGKLVVAAMATDEHRRWHPRYFNTKELPQLVRQRQAEFPGNKVIEQLSRCSFEYLSLIHIYVVVFGIETKIAQLLQVAVAVVVGVVVYIICTGWMRMEEFTMVKNMIKTRIQRRKANK